ncbi:MAG: calcium/sodium antiporter [Verrucomicrobiae bacterium]|nr:calcium/sodium antiporter [Verrucomicrobiae bacterium]
MLTSLLLIALGLVLLVAGAEALVRGASGLARAAGLSPLVIGLTVVAFGTSSPELAVSIKATLAGSGDLAIGNIAGSNIFNIAAILGLSALICPLVVNYQIVRLDMPVMLGASLLFISFCLTGEGISRPEAGVLFASVIAYTVFLVRMSRRESAAAKASAESLEIHGVPAEAPARLWTQFLLAAAGFGLLLIGARFLVDNAVLLARGMGVSEAVIGLTIVAAGTSLPELATSIVAAIRKETDVAIGNIVGSNIFNLLAIGGAAGLVRPIGLGNIDRVDLAVMFAVSLLLLPLMRTGFRLVRWEGAVLISAYVGYVALRWP